MRLNKSLIIILLGMVTLSACGDREKRNKRAEEKGQARTEREASFIKGIGEGLKGTGKEAIESVSEGVSELFKGANEGFDQSWVKVAINVAEELEPIVSISRSEIYENDSTRKKGILLYAVFEQDYNGKFLLKAFDKDDKEIARSNVLITEIADNSCFIEFPFDERTSFSLIKKLKLEHRPVSY